MTFGDVAGNKAGHNDGHNAGVTPALLRRNAGHIYGVFALNKIDLTLAAHRESINKSRSMEIWHIGSFKTWFLLEATISIQNLQEYVSFDLFILAFCYKIERITDFDSPYDAVPRGIIWHTYGTLGHIGI